MTVDSDRKSLPEAVSGPFATAPCLTTPAGFEAITTLNRRRAVTLGLNLVTWGLLMVWAGSLLALGGWTVVDCALLVALGLALPWPVLGFWNAAIGLWQLNGKREPAVLLATDAGPSDPIAVKTAVLMTLRNEYPERALQRLKIIKESLDRTGQGQHFTYFVLSDTDRADVARLEEDAVAAWRSQVQDGERIVYRRRDSNLGFKAGNVREFATTWGRDFKLMLPLDADSLMTGTAILELVRVMQSHPKIGILQSLVVGTPTTSAFARIFQFGMRLGMRSYTMGQAWWVGDCGPYWGHNALVRVAPFIEHCDLPVLPGKAPFGGPILSHDQIEAALMRRGEFEVRVFPAEAGSFEDNPPNAIAFSERDTRWCQGNLQYVKLVGMRGLLPLSRYQLIWAVLMFAGVPAWVLLVALTPFAASQAEQVPDFPFASASALALTLLLMYVAPKLAGIVNVISTPGEITRFGGCRRFMLGAAIEFVFSHLLAAVTLLRTTSFMVGLLFGKSGGWKTQTRDAECVGWLVAARVFWPQLVFGIVLALAFSWLAPHLLIWSLPLVVAFVAAIPFAVLSASPAAGAFLVRHGIAGVPEDIAPPPEIRALQAGDGV